MKLRGIITLLAGVLLIAGTGYAQKIKVIIDQDARGPATTDMQSILIFLQSDKFDVLGITTVSGDQWVKEETRRTLRLLEIAGRTDVPVVAGAELPLLNSKEETERWEALYGKFRYKGCWSDFSKRPESTPPAFRAGYHEPNVVPPLVEGRTAHQGSGRDGGSFHRSHGAPVSGPGSDLGGWPINQRRARSAARSGGRDAGQVAGSDGKRNVRGQWRHQQH